MELKYDVVIVGASFAGLTLAHHLPSDFKVLILDLKKEMNAGVESTGLITSDTFNLLNEFTNVNKFIPNKINSIGVVGTDYKKSFFSYTEKPWIYSTDTPELIKDMAENLPPNVALSIDSRFTSHFINPANVYPVEVSFTKNKEKLKVKSRFIVGADGAKSSVAKSDSSLSKNKKILVGLEKVFYGDILFGPHPKKAVYHYWFGEFSIGYGGWLSPTIINGKNAFRLGLAKKSRDADGFKKVDEFVEILQKEGMIEIKGNKKAVFQFASMIPVGGPLRNISNKYSILLGDAAGLCGAFAADGIKGAVLSGKIAAKLIPRHLSGEKKALNDLYKEIQKHNKLMTYYWKQVFYRWVWNFMKSNRTFDTMFAIIERSKEDFLNQFCDSKDKSKSLMSVVLKFSNLGILFKYSWFMFLDLFKRVK